MEKHDPEQVSTDNFPEPALAWPGDGPLPPARTSPRRTRLLRLALIFTPLLACVACVAVVLSLPLNNWLRPGLIPQTGGGAQSPSSDRLPPTAENTPQPGPDQSRPAPLTPIPMTPYRDAAEAQLITCSGSFQTLFLLERMAMRHTEMVESEIWRSDAAAALKAFRDDCGTLGSLPTAPDGYAEVERLIQQAAGEVEPAAEQFARALDGKDASILSASMDHMLLFLEYTHHAADALNEIVDRKQI